MNMSAPELFILCSRIHTFTGDMYCFSAEMLLCGARMYIPAAQNNIPVTDEYIFFARYFFVAAKM